MLQFGSGEPVLIGSVLASVHFESFKFMVESVPSMVPNGTVLNRTGTFGTIGNYPEFISLALRSEPGDLRCLCARAARGLRDECAVAAQWLCGGCAVVAQLLF